MLREVDLGGNFGKISLVGHPGFNDGKSLFEQFIANRNQGHFAILTLGYEAVIKCFTGRIRSLGREATDVELAANQAAPILVMRTLPRMLVPEVCSRGERPALAISCRWFV